MADFCADTDAIAKNNDTKKSFESLRILILFNFQMYYSVSYNDLFRGFIMNIFFNNPNIDNTFQIYFEYQRELITFTR
ncbi:hypothetical protein FNO01nite_29820 [Flavobacterium noncentrifugens]|nr:hypothetical protein FNO01nite_29820 [Flavobacterium noncentrifugens]